MAPSSARWPVASQLLSAGELIYLFNVSDQWSGSFRVCKKNLPSLSLSLYEKVFTFVDVILFCSLVAPMIKVASQASTFRKYTRVNLTQLSRMKRSYFSHQLFLSYCTLALTLHFHWLTADTGSTGSLECISESYPLGTFDWFNVHGKRITNSLKYSLVEERTFLFRVIHKLTIKQVAHSDAGELHSINWSTWFTLFFPSRLILFSTMVGRYTCSISNSLGTTSSKLTLYGE